MMHHEQTIAIRTELERLENAHGRLTATDVVEAARAPDNILHAKFEWDDRAAAHEHRLEQARQLIRSVRVEITVEEKTLSTFRYVRDPEANATDQGYVSVPQLRTEPDNAAHLVDQEFSRALACLLRAENIAAALNMHEEIKPLKKPLVAFQENWTTRFLAKAKHKGLT